MSGPYDSETNKMRAHIAEFMRFERYVQIASLGVVVLMVGLSLLSLIIDALMLIVKMFDTYGFKATCSFLLFAGVGSYVTAEILMVVVKIYCRNR